MKSMVPRFVSALIALLLAIGSAPAKAQQAQPDSLSVTLGVLQQRLQEAIAKKDYQTMESLTRTMTALAPQWPDAHYNLACALAMQGKRDEAVDSLTRSVALGFANAPLMESDADLASLRELTAFQASLAIAKRAYEVATAGQTPPPVPAPANPGGATPAPLGPMPEVRSRISGSTPLVTKPSLPAPGTKVGTKVKALWQNQWHPATIIGEQNGQYYIRYDVGSEANNEWLAAERISFPSTDGLPVAGDKVKVTWGGSLYESVIQRRDGQKWRIHYEGFPENMDETVGLDRLRDLKGQPFTAAGGDGAAAQPRPGEGPANGIPDPGAPVQPFLPRPAPPTAANALDWVYLETKILARGMGGNQFMPYRFMPDGTVVHGASQVDLTASAAFDYSTFAAGDPHYFGRYTRAGATLTLAFQGGTVRQLDIEDAEPAPKIPLFVRAGKVPQGTAMSGKYHAQQTLVGGAVRQSSGTISTAVWFYPGGAMRMTKDFSVFSASATSPAVQSSSTEVLSGSYSVKDWVITYEVNGKTYRAVIYAYDLDGGAMPPVIGFRSLQFKRAANE